MVASVEDRSQSPVKGRVTFHGIFFGAICFFLWMYCLFKTNQCCCFFRFFKERHYDSQRSCSTFYFINVHSRACISLIFQQFPGKPYLPLSGEPLYRREILYQRSPSGMVSLECQRCCSGVFIIIGERQRPGQGRLQCLAISALRLPAVIKQPKPDGRAL